METSVCEECKLNPWKYKCPGCSIRSCGLSCVKAHKKRTGCTGKRKLTDFVPLSKFDDNLLLSDYKMLEDTKRVAESAKRMRNQLSIYPYYINLPMHLRNLQNIAASRKIKLLILPNGMIKRENNKTRYWKSRILWTIEWRFHSTDVVLVEHRVGEDIKLCDVIKNHLKPGPWIHKLKPFCDVDMSSLKLFIRKDPQRAKTPFKELDIRASLRKQLADVVIIEYPVIDVYLPSHTYDFEVIRDFKHINTTVSIDDGQVSTNGITFREEEIVEDESSSFEPKVLDLIEQMKNKPCQRIAEESKVEIGKVTNNSQPQVDLLTEQEDVGNMDLEFEQELIDAYSDLFSDMDPNDYFNFECEFAKGLEDNDFCNLQNLDNDLIIDELEEGEIIE